MIAERFPVNSFENYLLRLRSTVTENAFRFSTFEQLEVELSESFVERDKGQLQEAFIRVFRALSSIRDVKVSNSNKEKFARLACNLMAALEADLEEDFNANQRAEDERLMKIENARKEEEIIRMKLMAFRKNSALSIRSTIGDKYVSSAFINHPIDIKYTSILSSWSMRSQYSFSPSSRGLINLGNTCYLNSVLQALNSTHLRQFFLKKSITNLVCRDTLIIRLVQEFYNVLQYLNSPSVDPLSPNDFFEALGNVYSPFKELLQQDANEFFNTLLNNLHSGLNTVVGQAKPTQIDNTSGTDDELAKKFWKDYIKSNKSDIVKLFAFQERSTVQCPNCGQIYRSFNPCFGVEVPIPKKALTCVEDCLASYCREEILDENSLYMCEKCNRKGRASQQLTFYNLPEILVITLKRFRSSLHLSEKVTSHVAFQPELDLSPFMCRSTQGAKYILKAVVNHTGTLNAGHYTADVRDESGKWSHCSDERVSECKEPHFDLAYILFYEKTRSAL